MQGSEMLFLQVVTSNQSLVVTKQRPQLFKSYRTWCSISPVVTQCLLALFFSDREDSRRKICCRILDALLNVPKIPEYVKVVHCQKLFLQSNLTLVLLILYLLIHPQLELYYQKVKLKSPTFSVILRQQIVLVGFPVKVDKLHLENRKKV